MCQATATRRFARVHFIRARIPTCITRCLWLYWISTSLGISGITHSRVHPKANLLQQKIRDCCSFLLNTFRYEDSTFANVLCLLGIAAPFLLFMWRAFEMIASCILLVSSYADFTDDCSRDCLVYLYLCELRIKLVINKYINLDFQFFL